MAALDWLDEELAKLGRAGLERTRHPAVRHPGPFVEIGGRRLLNLCSNDYLSLAGEPVASSTSGAGASRLVVGDLAVHAELEQSLARWLDVESVLLFTSGYAANVGIVSALADAESLIVSDVLNHASLIDGCRLSRARTVVVPHRDVEAVEAALRGAPERRRLVLTDGYFSMDGDSPDLVALRSICDRLGAALVIDEAHALGVWGPAGRGACAAAGVMPDVLVGTLGKSFGSGGAFVAGSRSLSRWLWNRARSFVFSTGLHPAAAAGALRSLPVVEAGERTRRLLANATLLRDELARAGVQVLTGSRGPILPIVLGDARRAVEAAGRLRELGVFVQPIRPPTVPRETSRLRVTVQAGHAEEDLRRAAETIATVVGSG